MKIEPQLSASIGLILGSFVAIGTAEASIHPLRFEDSVQSVFRQLYAPVEGLRNQRASPAPALPRNGLLELSETVFEFSAPAARDLAHLRTIAEKELVFSGGWEEFGRFEETLAANVSRKGVFFSPGMRRKIYVVGASLLWHQAQHLYDGGMPAIKAAEEARGAPLESIESEDRGWRAGCAFWNASLRMNAAMGAQAQPDPFRCDQGFPAAYYCKHHFAVELVLVTAYKLRLASRLAVDGGEASSSSTAVLERELAAYCLEYERSLKGNPLSLAGFKSEWAVDQCLDHAVKTVNAPGWKNSTVLCPAEADAATAAGDAH
ncbi:MAG: hypothetical protein HY927_06875 [Elusimicrobia bacterium]|nr:hypothetical protein [Elusimicrobiota bacterium]